MEITKQIRQKIFMLYWGQEVLSDGVNIGACVGDFDDNLYLELKSVDSLDYLEGHYVAELQDWQDCVMPIKVEVLASIIFRVSVSFGLEKLNYKTMDYLRSKGYAVPYLNWSVDDLIEEGIIKIKK